MCHVRGADHRVRPRRPGIVGALRAGRTADKAVLVVSTVLAAIPSFVAAIVLISVFAVRLGWFPTFGAGDGLVDQLYHLLLPSIALSLTFIALVARVTRSSMLDELDREHVEVALSRGVAQADRRASPRAAQRARSDPHASPVCSSPACWSPARSSSRRSASRARVAAGAVGRQAGLRRSCRRSSCIVVFAFVLVNTAGRPALPVHRPAGLGPGRRPDERPRRAGVEVEAGAGCPGSGPSAAAGCSSLSCVVLVGFVVAGGLRAAARAVPAGHHRPAERRWRRRARSTGSAPTRSARTRCPGSSTAPGRA